MEGGGMVYLLSWECQFFHEGIKVCEYTIKRMGGFFSRSASSSNCVIVDLRKIEQKGMYFKYSSAAGVLDAFKVMMGK
jgi:hypothetical protein